jgi:hypothetical protein
MRIRSVGAELFCADRRMGERQTDTTKLRKLPNAPKEEPLTWTPYLALCLLSGISD